MAALAMKTKQQLKAIYALASRLGMDAEMLHDFVFALTRRASIADLRKAEATNVIKTLLQHANPNALRKSKGNITYLVSIEQVEKIDALAKRMLWGHEQIDALSQRMYSQPFRRLRVNQAQGLIEGMKSILERKGTVAS